MSFDLGAARLSLSRGVASGRVDSRRTSAFVEHRATAGVGGENFGADAIGANFGLSLQSSQWK
jgi:hypothetical protein